MDLKVELNEERKCTPIGTEFVWFDLGYTLVHLNREEVFQKKLLARGISKSLEDLRYAYHLADKYFMREHPGLLGQSKSTFMHHYYEVLQDFLAIPKQPTQMLGANDSSNIVWRAFPETLPTLRHLKREGIGVGLISNWDRTAREVLKKTNIMPLLDEVVISSEVGIEKPDQRIFEHALQLVNVPAERSLYVGDNYYDDVVGSKKVGMQSVLVNMFDQQGIEELPPIPTIRNIQELVPIVKKRSVERKEEV